MSMVRIKGNSHLMTLINKLRKEKTAIWSKAAEMLERPRRNRVEVNLSKIDRYGKDGLVVLVPGKVLGEGKLSKKLTVAAFSFSASAEKSISESGGKTVEIESLLEKGVEPKNILLLS